MWVNFKTTRRDSQMDSIRPIPLHMPRDSARKTRPNGIKRQSSNQSSTRSARSNSSFSHLRKAIEEHYFKTQTAEWQKQEEYRCRRNRRKVRDKLIARRLRTVRRLYIPALCLMLFGIALIFCATIRSIGEGTFVWNLRDKFSIIGPVVLVLGVVLLLVVAGLESKLTEKIDHNKPSVQPFIHEDFKIERDISRQTSNETGSLDRGRSIYSLENSQNRGFFYANTDQSGDMSSNLSESLDCRQRLNLTSKWANAMQMALPPSPESNNSCQLQDTEIYLENNIKETDDDTGSENCISNVRSQGSPILSRTCNANTDSKSNGAATSKHLSPLTIHTETELNVDQCVK